MFHVTTSRDIEECPHPSTCILKDYSKHSNDILVLCEYLDELESSSIENDEADEDYTGSDLACLEDYADEA